LAKGAAYTTVSGDVIELWYDGTVWKETNNLTKEGGAAGSDTSAIHKDAANEISAITEKTILVDADLVIIEDSEDSFKKKKVKKSNLGGSSGGVEKWTSIIKDIDFNDQAASTSTITMVTDQTANIKAGVALKYKLSGTEYYGICTAITSTLLTILGKELTTGDGDLTELSYSNFPITFQHDIQIPGDYGKEINSYLAFSWFGHFDYWNKSDAILIGIKYSHEENDTGTYTLLPKIKIYDPVITMDGLEVSETINQKGVEFPFVFGDKIDIGLVAIATGTAPAHNSKNLKVSLIFVTL